MTKAMSGSRYANGNDDSICHFLIRIVQRSVDSMLDDSTRPEKLIFRESKKVYESDGLRAL
jgi:hypothetical protein